MVALLLALSNAMFLAADVMPESAIARYLPVSGGWHIHLSGSTAEASVEPDIGVVLDDARLHRRPLYPPADKSLIWNEAEQAKIQRCGFRPLVLAYNAPRFLFDFHSAGGLLGHLFLGLVQGEQGKWFHQWREIDVSYVEGRMEYILTDPEFPRVTIRLAAAALADSAGLGVKIDVEGASESGLLVWGYGGASAFFTNYAMNAPEFDFAPEQCAKDRLTWTTQGFELRRAFDDTDVYIKEVFAVTRYLPDWEARIRGGSSQPGDTGFGAPESFAASPKELIAHTDWVEPAHSSERSNCIVVYKIPLTPDAASGYVVVGMGENIDDAIKEPGKAFQAALARNHAIAERVVAHTPDPWLDAAVSMMAFATDGAWGDLAILHGGWSWRFAYLGWRGWYGSTCYGWTDRVKRSIESHTTLGLVTDGDDAGALGALLEYPPGVYYNMNEVFFDQVRQYFEYTNDLELMRRIFPILQGIAAWEDRRLQPEGAHLYENSLNTWISDSHWYIGGQCTQASAYMLRAYTFLAELAAHLGEDPAPYRQAAEQIRAAMQERLWMPDAGVFAEYIDTRGHRLLHLEPELPTIYHSAEFGAADAIQITQMLRWADTYLRRASTPGGGVLTWSSNWFPNRGRDYTHSTYELAYAENLNYALTNYLGGWANDAYAILRATLCGIFNGPTPGGLACHAYSDGRQRANDEFSDAISMWGRTVMEGLFGIALKRSDGLVELTPQFPADWKEASIATPHFAYQWRRDENSVAVQWQSPEPTVVRFRIPAAKDSTTRVVVDGRETTPESIPGGDVTWFQVTAERRSQGEIHVTTGVFRVPPVIRWRVGVPPEGITTSWKAPNAGDHDVSHWTLIDIKEVFNASVTEVLPLVEAKALPPAAPASRVGFDYWKSHLQGYHGARNEAVSDAAWRAKVGEDGVAWTTDGIPFHTAKEGPNIAVVTLAGGFPAEIEFPVNASGETLYLMLSGMTFPVQSHVVNLRVTLRYADGTTVANDLVNPFTIGDCWSTWCGRFHDTPANGFENIGGRSGPAGSAEVPDLRRPIAVDTEAHLIEFPLRPNAPLATVHLEAVANDAIFGVMGATVLK